MDDADGNNDNGGDTDDGDEQKHSLTTTLMM